MNPLQLTIDLTNAHMLIFGSGNRVIACVRDDEIELMEDLLLAVDNRLRLECIITWENIPSEKDWSQMAESNDQLSTSGFVVRSVAGNLSNSFIICDDTVIAFTEGLFQNSVSDDPSRVAACMSIFEDLSNRPELGEQIFLNENLVPSAEEEPDEFKERVESKLILASAFDKKILEQLSREPKDIFQLDPRRFEQLVAHITERLGYSVELTPLSKDGGRDIIAKRSDWTGNELLLIECKRYSPHRPVQVGIVRSFYGVVEHEEASRGLIVTTSHFSRGAIQFAQGHKNKIELNDYTRFIEQLRIFSKA